MHKPGLLRSPLLRNSFFGVISIIFLPFFSGHGATTATATLPKPDHVVIVMEENHAYSQIIGSSSAPYINALAQQGAFSEFKRDLSSQSAKLCRALLRFN